ncbi:MAG: hypothetical protein KC983_12765 [Phycisphaerales bacterium]|nr:hypothetical protein [Phycisphaerales bacterium]
MQEIAEDERKILGPDDPVSAEVGVEWQVPAPRIAGSQAGIPSDHEVTEVEDVDPAVVIEIAAFERIIAITPACREISDVPHAIDHEIGSIDSPKGVKWVPR